MEFDNDRPVQRTNPIEIFCWILLFLFYPAANFLTAGSGSVVAMVLMILASALVMPVYLLYSRVIVAEMLAHKRYLRFALLSIALYGAVHFLLYILYGVISSPQVESPPAYAPYFKYSAPTFLRESLWSIFYMLSSAAIAFFRKHLEDEDLVATLETDNLRFKLKYLRSQLNPHFLFNTLNSIYSLSLQKADETPEVVVKLADLMRYMIYDGSNDKVPLSKEIEFINNYIEIEKIRHKADIRFTVEGDPGDIMIEPLLFLPFIENSFKHAFDNNLSNAFIYINLKKESDRLLLSIVNNTSIDLESQAKRIQGSSLTNSKNILELLYPKSHELDIIQTDNEQDRRSDLRLRHARQRLAELYPDSHALDVILTNNAFTVSLMLKPIIV
ncbi:MAG TPA: sensor histidine kinase [Chitinophagaceae bacterium]